MNLVRISGTYFVFYALLLQVAEISVSAKEIKSHVNSKKKEMVSKIKDHQKPANKDDIKETLDEMESSAESEEIEREELSNLVGETKQGPDQPHAQPLTQHGPKPAVKPQQQVQPQEAEDQEAQMLETDVLQGAAQGPQEEPKPQTQPHPQTVTQPQKPQQAQPGAQPPVAAPPVQQNPTAQTSARCTPQQLAAQQQLQQAQEAMRIANQQAAQGPGAAGCAQMLSAYTSNLPGAVATPYGAAAGGLPPCVDRGAATGDYRYQYGSSGMTGPGGIYGPGGMGGASGCPPGYGPPGSQAEMPFGSPASDYGFGMDLPGQGGAASGSCKSKFEHCKKQCLGSCPKRCCSKEKKGKKT